MVWTGDDRVFFFNPTMQLSVWEKPVDLRHRGDLNRIIEDPPHKRKLEASAGSGRGSPHARGRVSGLVSLGGDRDACFSCFGWKLVIKEACSLSEFSSYAFMALSAETELPMWMALACF